MFAISALSGNGMVKYNVSLLSVHNGIYNFKAERSLFNHLSSYFFLDKDYDARTIKREGRTYATAPIHVYIGHAKRIVYMDVETCQYCIFHAGQKIDLPADFVVVQSDCLIYAGDYEELGQAMELLAPMQFANIKERPSQDAVRTKAVLSRPLSAHDLTCSCGQVLMEPVAVCSNCGTICQECGNYHAKEDGISFELDGKQYHFCDATCAEKSGFAQCAICKTWEKIATWDYVYHRENHNLERSKSGVWYHDYCLDETAELAFCEICGELEKREAMASVDVYYQGRTIQKVCQSCMSEIATCAECGEQFHLDDLTDIDGNLICNDCISENYAECAYCHAVIQHVDDMIDVSGCGQVCQDCIDNHFSYCDNCEEYYLNSCVNVVGDMVYCNDCYDNLEPEKPDCLHSYSHKPCPLFYKTEQEQKNNEKSLLFGFENEFTYNSYAERNDNLQDIMNVLNKYQRDSHFYAKEDCSTGFDDDNGMGFELVSHPMSLDYLHSIQDRITKGFTVIRDTYCGKNKDGLHVHVSKKGMTEAHKIRLGSFVAIFQSEFKKIARRNSQRWAAYEDKPVSGLDCKYINDSNRYCRYKALNWQNRATLEFRIFRNTTNVTVLMASIELCHAVYTFTKHNSIARIFLSEYKTWQKFVEFVRNEKRYSHLLKICIDKEVTGF